MPFGLEYRVHGADAPVDPVDALISNFFNDARARVQSQDFASVFNDMLTTHDSGPGPRPLPPPVSPFGAMASTFAATLADQLGANGAQGQNAQRLAQHDAERQNIAEANRSEQVQNARIQDEQHLRIQMAINSAKMEQMKQLNDLDEYEARLKTQRQLRKEQIKLQADAKEESLKQMNQAIFDRVITTEKLRGQNRLNAINYTHVLKEAFGSDKIPEAVKIWAQAQKSEIFAKDEIGSYVHNEEERNKMQADLYEQMLQKSADYKNPSDGSTDGGGLFDF